MSRKTEKPATPVPGKDGRQEYRLADGVIYVNGQKVTTETVRLTAAEALQDMSLGRISLAGSSSGDA